jgi:lipid-binding SYLF domain-containing protein
MRKTATLFMVLIIIILLAGLVNASEYKKQQELVDKARITVDSFISDKNLEWFRNNVKNAKALLIIPELMKGGFVIGGSGGRGVLLVKDEVSGDWSNPAFYSIGSVSLGIQIGGKISEVVMMVMTKKGLESLYGSSFKLGGDMSVAAGPVGATAEGGTAPSRNIDYLSFAQSKGAFAGVSLDGAVVKTNDEWNSVYYGASVKPPDILVSRSVANADADHLRHAVSRATSGITIKGKKAEDQKDKALVEEKAENHEEKALVEEKVENHEEKALVEEKVENHEEKALTEEKAGEFLKKETELEQIREKYQEKQ